MAGQYSRQVPNQAGTSLPALQQRQNMIHNSEGSHVSLNMEPGFDKARRFIQDRIYEFLMQRQNTRDPKSVLDIVRRLEEGLFKTATSKEEYMCLDTLESRLLLLIRRTSRYHPQQSNPSAMGTMIPTPGVPQSGPNNMVPSSADVMVSSSSVNTGSFSMGAQMMPTPGFNNSNVSVLSSVDSTMVSQSQPQQKQQLGGQNSRILHNLGSHMEDLWI
ncbi:hypothetical protein L2E82_46958 [Cichorium intybus]|uniref:Uncharacterized protein n=1 Tax=Cichorium intybus TaxID=13427 RepID=A0ACB8YVA6_CICIN|nr:hypothetical protein L2E82_46958 [Cichorium intybus]